MQGREMLDEAKATRERVLADLLRRRELLQAQVDELRGGRDHLLDAYRVVKRTFLEATESLAQVEARAAERVPPAPDSSDIPISGDAESDGSTGDAIAEAVTPDDADDAAVTVAEPGAVEPEAEAATGDSDATDPSLADVDSLFARIRAGQTEAPVEAAAAPAPAAAAGTIAARGRRGPARGRPRVRHVHFWRLGYRRPGRRRKWPCPPKSGQMGARPTGRRR